MEGRECCLGHLCSLRVQRGWFQIRSALFTCSPWRPVSTSLLSMDQKRPPAPTLSGPDLDLFPMHHLLLQTAQLPAAGSLQTTASQPVLGGLFSNKSAITAN